MSTYVYGKLTYTNNGTQTKYVLVQFTGGVVKYYQNNSFVSFTSVDGAGTDYNAVTYLPNTQAGLLLANGNLAQLIANDITGNTNSTTVTLEFWQIVTATNNVVQVARDAVPTTFSGVNFTNIDFTNCRFNIDATNKTTFNNTCNFTGANLSNVNLSNAVINANTVLTNTNFYMVNLSSATITGVDFSQALNILSLTNLNVNGGITVTNTGSSAVFPPYTSIVQTATNISIQVPVTVDESLAGGSLTATASPSDFIPAGSITINTTTNVINNLPNGVNGNIGRLIPLNVLKLARAVGAVVNIQ